jgi:hypothetical protein
MVENMNLLFFDRARPFELFSLVNTNMPTTGGGLNLVNRGTNNVFLVGNPQKSFFTATYRKHTDFGMQKFRIDYNGLRNLRLTESSTFRFKIPRYGDLLMDTYLVLNLPSIWSPIYHPCQETGNQWSAYEFRWIHDLGFQAIEEIEITCGSQTLQKYSGAYLSSIIARDYSTEKCELAKRMSGNLVELNDPANAQGRVNTYPSAYYTSSSVGAEPSIRGKTLFIPIHAWFTTNAFCAFPLCALQYNELYVNITLRPIQELYQVRDVFDPINQFPYVQPDYTQNQFGMYRFLQTPPAVVLSTANYENTSTDWNADIHLISTFAFLSEDERQNFAKKDQLYLIKDIYTYTFENVAGNNRVKLLSNGMVANWTFSFQRNDVNMRNEWSNYTNWPYLHSQPGKIIPAPEMDVNSPFSVPSLGIVNSGPFLDPSGGNTGYFITGTFNADNQKEILQTMAILLNGSYRENTQLRGVFDYIEKYTRSSGGAPDGIYFYQFGLHTDPYSYQPSGAINLSNFNNIEFEFSTFLPSLDTTNSSFTIFCDGSGNPIGVNKQNWKLYNYNYNLIVHEERYNIVSILSGNVGLMYAR